MFSSIEISSITILKNHFITITSKSFVVGTDDCLINLVESNLKNLFNGFKSLSCKW